MVAQAKLRICSGADLSGICVRIHAATSDLVRPDTMSGTSGFAKLAVPVISLE